MLFDLRPKESKDDLFDRESELESLHRLVQGGWVVILGRRMSGKTSLLKVFLNEVGGVYVNLSGARSVKDLTLELMKHARRLGIEVSLGPVSLTWSKLAEDVLSRFEGRVIGLDEAQDLPVNYTLRLLKRVWDTYDIKIVFTGSMMGLITGLLRPTPQSPLYGRMPAEVQLGPFTEDQSIEFLREGFKECGLTVPSDEIKEAVEALNGYPGWLAYYGNLRCMRNLRHREALDGVYREGKSLLMEELRRFLSTRRNPNQYVRLLKNLPARWSELKNALEVNSKVLSGMLHELEGAMIVEKVGNTYIIPDPVMKGLIMEL